MSQAGVGQDQPGGPKDPDGAGAGVHPLVERFDIEPYSDFFSQMIKLYRARSPLYRRQILQENIRWKALDEIYKSCMLFGPLGPQYFSKIL